MTLSLVATSGASNANSFVTEAEQVAYMATRLNASTWTTVSGATLTETEKAAVIEATRYLSALTTWAGSRATATQKLAWPRQLAPDPDSPTGDYFGSTTIPDRLKDATAELAFQFLKAGTADVAGLNDADEAVTESTVEVLTTRYDVFLRAKGLDRLPSVMRHLAPLLAERSSYSTRLDRG